MRDRVIVFIFIIVLSILIVAKPSLGWNVRRALEGVGIDIPQGELLRENASLKAEIAALSALRPFLAQYGKNGIPALVHSSYPFTAKQELLISVGRIKGVKKDDAVVLQREIWGGEGEPPIFIGQVIQVHEETALVRTVFDPRFEAPVRIGKEGIEALLVGGTNPRITLIAKQATIQDGDAVILVSPKIPYGLALGTMRDPRLQKDELFQEASLDIPYNNNAVTGVMVVQGYAGQ